MQNNIINGVIYKKSRNKTRNIGNNLTMAATTESGPFAKSIKYQVGGKPGEILPGE